MAKRKPWEFPRVSWSTIKIQNPPFPRWKLQIHVNFVLRKLNNSCSVRWTTSIEFRKLMFPSLMTCMRCRWPFLFLFIETMIALEKKILYFPCSVFGLTIGLKKKRFNRCSVEKSYAIPPHDSKWDWSLRCICSAILFVLSFFFSPRASG